jgi:hypothetical protein
VAQKAAMDYLAECTLKDLCEMEKQRRHVSGMYYI